MKRGVGHELRAGTWPWSMRALQTLSLLVAVLTTAACEKKTPGPEPGATAVTAEPAVPAPTTITVAYGSEKKSWLTDAIQRFNATSPRLPDGTRVQVEGQAVGSGAAVEDLVDGTTKAHAWAPASTMYREVFRRAWAKHAGTLGASKEPLDDGKSLVLSPVVIAMWKPMAQALGWPDAKVGWSDVLSLARNPQGWAAKGHPEWGALKFGHTHPMYSNSGTLSVLAEAYAALGLTRGLSREALAKPAVATFMESIEQSVVHYGKSTGFFSEKMLARGPSYLSAAVLYENLVVDSYRATGREMDLVCVYPKEGTFWIDNPFYVLDAPWTDPAHKQGAILFRDFLLGAEQQRRAMTEFGFRPVDPKIPVGAPLDAEHGVNPKEPQTLLEVPDTDVVTSALELWARVKKTVDILFVFDRSGSMKGEPLRQAKQGAIDFLEQLDGRDRISILMFNDKVPDPVDPVPVGDARNQLKDTVAGVFADGGTSLYDAVAKGHEKLTQLAGQNPKRTFALVVMTDGKDESSKMRLETIKDLVKPNAESGDAAVRLFTIAYGKGTDATILADLAETGGGATFKGDTASIRQVYRDLASFF